MRGIARGLLFATGLAVVLGIEGALTGVVVRTILGLLDSDSYGGERAAFVKVMPTIVNAAFGGTLLLGVLSGANIIKYPLQYLFRLSDEGWRKVALRSGWFFLVLAMLNELVWRVLGEQAWVYFKVFGTLPIVIIFCASQIGVVNRQPPADT